MMKMKLIYCNLLMPLLLIGCDKSAQQRDEMPVHESFTIESKQVGETRNINVWMPPSYKASPDSLPVLYMADGGLKEDFPHVANTLAELVEAKRIPPIMLVGIENTERKRDLTGPTTVAKDKEIAAVVGGSAKFRAFIKTELFPAINIRYRTKTEKGLIGESLAGLFVVETLELTPDMFDYYIAMDPALWWNDNHLVKTAAARLQSFPPKKIKFWFAGSSVQKETPIISNLNNILKANAPQTLEWQYSDEPSESHGTIFRATKEKALVWTLNGN